MAQEIYLALPFYKQTNPRTCFALLALMDRTRVQVSLDFGDAFIVHSRNKLADGFLASGLPGLVMLVDDMIPPFGNANLYRSFTGFSRCPDKFAGVNVFD